MAVDGEYLPNNREQVFANIAGMHAAAAMLTKQPIFALQEPEANALTTSLCDVLDAHKINITSAGGRAGLYVSLALTVYGIYAPRLKALKGSNKNARPVNRATPSTASEAATAVAGGFTMDFTGDTEH